MLLQALGQLLYVGTYLEGESSLASYSISLLVDVEQIKERICCQMMD